jgi:hypothetical protein
MVTEESEKQWRQRMRADADERASRALKAETRTPRKATALTKEQQAVEAIGKLYWAARKETMDSGATRVERTGAKVFQMIVGRKPTPEEIKAMFY